MKKNTPLQIFYRDKEKLFLYFMGGGGGGGGGAGDEEDLWEGEI